MPRLSNLLDFPALYRLWQAPFAAAKLRPLRQQNNLKTARRVLDVGCGPGTNSTVFSHTDYLGLDLNERYIKLARQRYRGRFEVADVRSYQPPAGEAYDFILLNSFLHHIDDENTDRILANMNSLLSDDGYVHILELVMPDKACISRWLARHDRGEYPRPLEKWKEIFSAHFHTVTLQPYPLGLGGITLWNMVYFKGRRHDV